MLASHLHRVSGFESLRSLHEARVPSQPRIKLSVILHARLKSSQAHSLPQLHSKFKASLGLRETGVLE